jgi:hypothetical protein
VEETLALVLVLGMKVRRQDLRRVMIEETNEEEQEEEEGEVREKRKGEEEEVIEMRKRSFMRNYQNQCQRSPEMIQLLLVVVVEEAKSKQREGEGMLQQGEEVAKIQNPKLMRAM